MKTLKKLRSITMLILGCGLLHGGSTFAVADSSVVNPPKTQTSVNSTTREESLSDLISKYESLLAKTQDLNDEKLKLLAENISLKHEQVTLKHQLSKSNRRVTRYKDKLSKSKANITPEELQNEVERVRAQMILEFTKYLGEYVKNNPGKKMKNVDLKGLFSDFITFNVNYTNRGDTTFSPLAVKATAKGTVAGAAIG